jgi:hypothetical protein
MTVGHVMDYTVCAETLIGTLLIVMTKVRRSHTLVA